MPLKVSDGMSAWIDDFAKSDAPQFKGKNKDERRDMAIAAYLSAKRGNQKEEAVNELDTSTLVSYRKKANKQRYSNNISKRTQRTIGVDRADKKLRKRNIDKFGDHSPKGVDRMGNRKEDSSDAVKAFLAKGGKIKKLAPGKAAGYHGKDDPGKDMHGMMDRPDTKRFGTRKKVGSMRENVEEARAPRMKYALVGAKDMKIYATNSDERDARMDRRSLEKRFKQPMKIARLKTAQTIGDKVDKSQIKESSIKESAIWEAIDPKIQRVKMLARLGLVGKSDVNKLMMAMKAIDDGKELNKQYRNIIFDAFNDLIDLVTGDTTVFQKAKKAVAKEEVVLEGKMNQLHMYMKQGKSAKEIAKLMKLDVKTIAALIGESTLYEADDKDPGEYDDEGIMMKDKLDIIMDACDEMYDIVEDDENLPEWVQDKVTKAADYIDSARDYLMSQKKDNSDD